MSPEKVKFLTKYVEIIILWILADLWDTFFCKKMALFENMTRTIVWQWIYKKTKWN